jgi:spore coat polysaccharide biosynthesis protein SpsF
MLIVIQARMNSGRFPGKMLAKLEDWKLIMWVIQTAQKLGNVVVATEDTLENNVIAKTALDSGCGVIRARDPIDRYIMASRKSDYIMRVCGDNPFFSLSLARELINEVEKNPGADYYAHYIGDDPAIVTSYGLFAEVFRSQALLDGLRKTKAETFYREHVTNMFYLNEDIFNIQKLPVDELITEKKFSLTVDTKDDINRLDKMLSQLPENFDYPEILDVVSENKKYRTKTVEKNYDWYVHNC